MKGVLWDIPLTGNPGRHGPVRAGHQPADEMDIATEPAQLRHDDWCFDLLGRLERRGELRPTVERIGALAGLDLVKSLEEVLRLLLGPVDMWGNALACVVHISTGLRASVDFGAAMQLGASHNLPGFQGRQVKFCWTVRWTSCWTFLEASRGCTFDHNRCVRVCRFGGARFSVKLLCDEETL
jgi:hypothetical protein